MPITSKVQRTEKVRLGLPVCPEEKGHERQYPENYDHDNHHANVKDQVVLIHGIEVDHVLPIMELACQIDWSLTVRDNHVIELKCRACSE